MDFYRDEQGNIYMTSEQIGRALEYAYPAEAVRKIRDRFPERFEGKSVQVNLTSTDGKQYATRIYNEQGIYELIRKSNQPKADAFFDWVCEVLSTIRKTGAYGLPTARASEREVRTHILRAVLETEERTNALEQRVDAVERTTTLDYGQQRRLNKAINRKVYSIAAEPNERRDYFSQLHRDIKDRWAVASYRDVLRVELDEVLRYIDAWKPRIV